MDDAKIQTYKYQKLIEQLHPRLEIMSVYLDGRVHKNRGLFSIHHFPRLEILLKNGDLKSVFQPIIEINNRRQLIHGIECLSRFHFDGKNFTPEFIFNYASEKLKLTNCDKICLMQAIRIVPHSKSTLIFVNVRPQTLIGEDFYPWFRTLLKNNNLLPEQIVIEITEQYCNISEQEMITKCENLRSQGFKLAVDDFGSGISNLSMLEITAAQLHQNLGSFYKKCTLRSREAENHKECFGSSARFWHSCHRRKCRTRTRMAPSCGLRSTLCPRILLFSSHGQR